MKVLHIWNTAGVGSVIAKYMDRIYGTQSWLMHRRAFDPYGFTVYGELLDSRACIFKLKCLLEARKYDVIHVHTIDELVPFLKLLYPHKPVVLHYHGSEIRGKWGLKKNYWEKADLIFYSTLDLKEPETPDMALYLPNPVDLDYFRPCPKACERGKAAHFSYRADDLAHQYAEKYNLKLDIYDKENHGNMPYIAVSGYLCKFEFYIDVKRDRNGNLYRIPLSKTALEALACGLKVIDWKGDQIEGFPQDNHYERVVSTVYEKYLNLFKGQK